MSVKERSWLWLDIYMGRMASEVANDRNVSKISELGGLMVISNANFILQCLLVNPTESLRTS